MVDIPSILLRRLLTPRKAAGTMGVAEQTLAQWRSQGVGPKYIRVGRLIRYSAEDIAAFLKSRTVRPKPPRRATERPNTQLRKTA